MPDVHSVYNAAGGALKRFCAQPPGPVSPGFYSSLRSFTRNWVRANLRRLVDSDILTVEDWLETTRYPAWRKKELLGVYHKYCGSFGRSGAARKKFYKCKSFVKTEQYSEFKWPRCINSRHDLFKVITGPFFHAVESVVFKMHYFIKHIDVNLVPRHIANILGENMGDLYSTDYSSFEALFTTDLMSHCEFQLYEFMSDGNRCRELLPLIKTALGGINECHFRGSVVKLGGVRMSGDMCTSLGNGFTNLMLMLHWGKIMGATVDGVVEGDDGLFAIRGAKPTSEDFESMGMKLKCVPCDSLGVAGFCKKYFDPVVMENVVDPSELLVKFGWSHSIQCCGGPEVRNALLHAKADSLESTLPCAPIVGSLVRYVRRCVPRSARRVVTMDDDWSHNHSSGVLGSVSPLSRIVVARVFGVSIEHQLCIEKYIDTLKVLQPLDSPCIHSLMKQEWLEYHDRYVFCIPRGMDL